MPKYMMHNFHHFKKVIAKDMCHCRHPAAGSLINYAVVDGLRHVQPLLLGHVLDTESFRSWTYADDCAKECIPGLDAKEVVMIGDGQKGELKSHKTQFSKALLRACTRHRGEELRRDRRAGAAAARLYNAATLCKSTESVDAIFDTAIRESKGKAQPIVDRIKALPMEVQFPAYAAKAGYGTPEGRNTSNAAEVPTPCQ